MSKSPPRRSATRATSYTLITVGGGLMMLALLADVLGFGGGKGFGYQQLIVLIIGLVLTLGGMSMLFQTFINRNLLD